MKKLKYVFLLFVLTRQSLFSQELIKGTIKSAIDQTKIENANIYLGNSKGTSSDKNGYYELERFNAFPESTVTISAIGFKTMKLKSSALIEDPNIFLEEDVFSLNEVVISPINALPITKKSHKNNKKNYKTNWLSSKVKVTQFLFVEYDSIINKKHFLGKMVIEGRINFKGYSSNNNVKWRIDNVKATKHFLKYDTIKKPPFNKVPISLNLYDFFNQYEFSTNAKKGLGFLLDADFSKNYRKVIDFDSLNSRKHYLIKTKPLKSSSVLYNEQKDFKKVNENYQKIRKSLVESIPNSNLMDEKVKDSLVNNILKGGGVQQDLLGYAWIDYENYVASRLFYKIEMYTKSGNPFNRIYRDIIYKPHDENYVPEKLEVVFKVFSLNGINIYKYVRLDFSDYGSREYFNELNTDEILDKDYSLKPIKVNTLIDQYLAREEFFLLREANFLKPLRKTINTSLDDFLND